MGCGSCQESPYFPWWIARYRVQLVVILTPLILLPLPLVIGDDASVAGYLLLLMATYWCTDIIPLAVTGLIPVFFLPFAELLPLEEVCYNYLDDSTVMLVGSMMVAISIEVSNLHRRVALAVLMLVGTRPQWLMFGFMLPTFVLSMFINNTSTTAMMLPIMEAVLAQLDPKNQPTVPDTDSGKSFILEVVATDEAANHAYENPALMTEDEIVPALEKKDKVEDEIEMSNMTTTPVGTAKEKEELPAVDAPPPDYNEEKKMSFASPTTIDDVSEPSGAGYSLALAESKMEEAVKEAEAAANAQDEEGIFGGHLSFEDFGKAMTLSICYTANVGGVATLTGTTPNIIMSGFVEDIWGEHGLESPVNYATWMVFGFPVACINFFFVWGWLLLFYLGYRGFMCCCCAGKPNEARDAAVKATIHEQYHALGNIRFEEVASGFMFIALILLWFFRSPGFMTGWGDYFEEGYIGDAVPAILIAFCLFFIPAELPKTCKCGDLEEEERTQSVRVLLDWQTVHEKYPWSIIFLMGGGYALADACDVSGLSQWIGEQMTVLDALPEFWMLYFLCLLTMILTSIMSNSAACTILMPIMATMAEELGYNPLYLMFPVCVSTSMAFMLPVATPPNAIAYSYGRITTMDMVKAGFVLNLLCAITISVATMTWGDAYFDFDTIPWETENATTVTP